MSRSHPAAEHLLIEFKSRFSIINKSSYLQGVGRPRPCRDWLFATVPADGGIHAGCMISALEPRYYLSHLRDYLREFGR